MVMSIGPNGQGGLQIRQTMVRPLIYFDHWAVRRFADEDSLGDRFIDALHAAQGTWVFSAINVSEFIAMRDVPTARRVEALIARAFPHFFVLDMVNDTDLILERNPQEQRPATAPDEHWLLADLGARAQIADGAFNTHAFISDAITHADTLLPLFEFMKRQVAEHIVAARRRVLMTVDRSQLVPRRGMSLKNIFIDELLMEPLGKV